MGYSAWAERQAQVGMLKRAVDASWIAQCAIGMIWGPLLLALKSTEQGISEQFWREVMKQWDGDWKGVRHFSDRNLGRNRDHYDVRPNLVLSPILRDTEVRVRAIEAPPGSPAALDQFYDAVLATVGPLYEFGQWSVEAGRYLRTDMEVYQDSAASKAQRYWRGRQRELAKWMG